MSFDVISGENRRQIRFTHIPLWTCPSNKRDLGSKLQAWRMWQINTYQKDLSQQLVSKWQPDPYSGSEGAMWISDTWAYL